VNSIGENIVARKRNEQRKCQVCSCTETTPCNPPCAWSDIDAGLCTTCEEAANAVAIWIAESHQPDTAALLKQARVILLDAALAEALKAYGAGGGQ